MPKRPSLYLDTIVISNFTLVGQLDFLIASYPSRLLTTVQVADELLAGVRAGHGSLADALDRIARGVMPSVNLAAKWMPTYRNLRRTLGAGESSVIAMAKAGGGVVATDDRAARQICSRLGVNVTGTVGLLLAAVRDGRMTLLHAEFVLASMVDHGFYSPVRCLADLLD